eukprot:TRINITY_DN3271_c0_g1_i2.p1 TRINITY_DN3271_c0_g1~~TRINITY_DN3271_c0_g1_i2.p1  ORF type:complete len:298 (-),score=18.34 TRINITY_DN3271_c0_g1_i2:125-1018(-)
MLGPINVLSGKSLLDFIDYLHVFRTFCHCRHTSPNAIAHHYHWPNFADMDTTSYQLLILNIGNDNIMERNIPRSWSHSSRIGYFPLLAQLKGQTPPKDSKLSEKFLTRMCMKCNNSWKPPRAHHCSVCNRCVFRMDHHCDWLNNCVGIGTIKLFYLFLVYTALHCFHTLTCLALEFGLTFHFRGSEILYELVIDVQARKILGIAFAFFGLFFLIFTLDFIYEQTTCIFANQTIIDSEQNIRGSPRSKTANFSAVFGGEPSFRWLLPNPAQAPVDYEEMLYRFRVVPPSNLNGHDKAE